MSKDGFIVIKNFFNYSEIKNTLIKDGLGDILSDEYYLENILLDQKNHQSDASNLENLLFGRLNNANLKGILDLNKSETLILWILAVPTVFFGFYPEPLFGTIETSVSEFLIQYNVNINLYVTEK